MGLRRLLNALAEANEVAEWINHSGLKRSPWRGFEPGARADERGAKGSIGALTAPHGGTNQQSPEYRK